MTREKNVSQFNRDIETSSGYLYSAPSATLSSRLANRRLSEAVQHIIDMSGKRVIDIGCGDGAYTCEFLAANPKYVLGIDAAEQAVAVASKRSAGIDRICFRTMDICDLSNLNEKFEIAVVRGLLHHLYDVQKAIDNLSGLADVVIVIEPNGYNPLLKIIEKTSNYHIKHEERSYAPHKLDLWFRKRGGHIKQSLYCGLVPFFCPDLAAKILKMLEPVVERIPLVRQLLCAVYVFKVDFKGYAP